MMALRDAVLQHLYLVGPCTTTQLATILGTDRSHLSRLLRRLAHEGLLAAEPWRGRPVWSLTRLTLEALAVQQGYPASTARWMQISGYSGATRAHDLGVIDILQSLVRASHPPESGVLDWQGPGLSALPYARWVTPVGKEPRIHGVTLSPDATLEYLWQAEPHPLYLRALVEFDTGSERPPAIQAKAERYNMAAHPDWFVLLIVTTGGPQRLATLLGIFRKELPDTVIIAGAMAGPLHTNPTGEIWWTPDGKNQAIQDLAVPVTYPEAPEFWGGHGPRGARDSYGRFAPGFS